MSIGENDIRKEAIESGLLVNKLITVGNFISKNQFYGHNVK